MPKRTDIDKILIIGSGPIVIGQGCEFDYSGTQACKALKEEGFEIVLINSNPATIMTDPELADHTYIEPLTAETVIEIIKQERPHAILTSVGGQTALNLAVELSARGVLETYYVELIGAKLSAIKIAEDRKLFKQAMDELGLAMPRAAFVTSLAQALMAIDSIGYPAVIRPSFTLGGSGGGIAYNEQDYREIVTRGLNLSPAGEVLVEESIMGWKEYELEMMRDLNDNVVIVCTIENFDPMGVHTGDSITVAPAQTLSDYEYQTMRDAAVKIMRKVGIETGGANIQFAVNPIDGQLRVIEMNPRVSRSSALASKATGFPIAKIAAKLAVGYTLDEIPNDITKKTPASFEPTMDYVVVKVPKWAFEKFPAANATLGTQMKSVGEVMAIGRTFKEALLKGVRSLELGRPTQIDYAIDDEDLHNYLTIPNAMRLSHLRAALERGWDIEWLYQLTAIDRWFLEQLRQIAAMHNQVKEHTLNTLPDELLYAAKRIGLSDQRLALLLGGSEKEVRARRLQAGIKPVYKRVDSCAAEFESTTPYLYSTYEVECEAEPTDRKKIMILGSGPNRIGQGIEFDYCCCHASFALREAGYETIMVNCNPETVSTDYDTSDRLYFEPITFEDVMNIIEVEKPDGVIVQFGGQTPLNLSLRLLQAGVPIIGTSPASIDLAEDRERFGRLLAELAIPQPANGITFSVAEGCRIAAQIGYPVLVRPSYVLGGRAMVIVNDEESLAGYIEAALQAAPDRAILIDNMLEKAVEVDIDALCDGQQVVIAGIQEHIEEAGIHSGDSSCVLPPVTLEPDLIETMRIYARKLALALRVVGLVNIQFAIKDGKVYVLEVNPRASRTVPFVSKATGVPIAKIAALLMVGHSLSEFNLPEELGVDRCYVKTPVFPFAKFPGVDPILGPEMRSTGEVMGMARGFGAAYLKAQFGAGTRLPRFGDVYITAGEAQAAEFGTLAQRLCRHGFKIVSDARTSRALAAAGVNANQATSPQEIIDGILSEKITMVVDTSLQPDALARAIRSLCVQRRIPCITTVSGAQAALAAIAELGERLPAVCNLQEQRTIPWQPIKFS